MATEAQLMRVCGQLYASIALESFGTTVMTGFFMYFLLLITNKGRISDPGRAFTLFVTTRLNNFVGRVSHEVGKWSQMNKVPLERRFAACRKINQAICVFQIAIALLSIERWLHINNVNGFRYLGYAFTCPPMQVELVVLIAPKVPCFKTTCILIYFTTVAIFWFGYATALIGGPIHEGSFLRFFETWDLEDLQPTRKFWMLVPSCGAQAALSFIFWPYLAFLYTINGGPGADLPHGYLKLLLLVFITWLAFPVWWIFSYEGMAVITDTKLNAIGFGILNLIAKASYTLHMHSMTRCHTHAKMQQEAIASGNPLSLSMPDGLFDRQESYFSDRDEDAGDLATVQRDVRFHETWVVQLLRPYDSGTATHQNWAKLPPTYRAYLMGQGVTPTSFEVMTIQEKKVLREQFDSIFDSVDGIERQVSQTAGEISFPPPQPLAEESLEEQATFDSQHLQSRSFTKENSSLKTDDAWNVRRIKLGQKVRTLGGLEGKVLKNMGHELILLMPGNFKQTVGMDDLAKIKVTIIGARGILSADWQGKDNLMPFCTCMLTGKPSSEVRTRPVAPTSRATWKYEAELYGFKAGNSLTLCIWGFEPSTRDEQLLCEATLQNDMFIDDVFDGEVQLFQNKRPIQAYLKVVIASFGFPGDGI